MIENTLDYILSLETHSSSKLKSAWKHTRCFFYIIGYCCPNIGTMVALSPQVEAVSDTMHVQITFWMDGTTEFPVHLKMRRCYGYK